MNKLIKLKENIMTLDIFDWNYKIKENFFSNI